MTLLKEFSLPTIITHGISALIIGKALTAEVKTYRFWFYVMLCSMIPDLDVIGFRFGIKYGDLWGHRGMTHSILFAVVVGTMIGFFYVRRARQKRGVKEQWFWSFFFSLIIASHGFFDALTDGGLGVAFFSPFDTTRYFFSWTPVKVSPIGTQGFFSQRGVDLMVSETLFITFPLLIFLAFVRRVLRQKYSK
ncbi:MAG: metal-dependent hydrolase [Bdellovibrionales bacterium]|nr:metal-dependent hydrolase [Bdellovibrionales bacterium]